MQELLTIAQSITERGLIYALIVAGVYITSRIIHFDDLTVEGSFGIGGAVMAAALVNNVHPIVALLLAAAAGGLAGATTAVLHTKLKLNNLISGIVVTTALFSISLKVASAHKDLSGMRTLFEYVSPAWSNQKALLMLVPLVCSVFMLIKWFLQTEYGFLLHAVGQNPQMLINLNKNPHHYLILALVLSNMLTGIAGALFVQYAGYFSIWANVGILIISLIGLMLAQLFSKQFGFALLFGAIMYQTIIMLTYELNIDQDWNKLINAILIIALMIVNQLQKRPRTKEQHA